MGTTSDFRRVFPAAAPVPRITTDTDHLYIHNIEAEDGKVWIFSIKRLDAKGGIIQVTDESDFPLALVYEAMELAKELLNPKVYVPMEGQSLCFSTDGDKVSCFQEEIGEDNESAPKKEFLPDLEKCPRAQLDGKGGKSVAIVARLHQIFFETRYDVDARASIRPTYEPPALKPVKLKYKEAPKEQPASGAAAPDKVKKPKNAQKNAQKSSRKKTEVPEDILDSMPEAIQESTRAAGSRSQASVASQNIPKAADYLEELIHAIDHPTRKALPEDCLFKKPKSLQDLSYKTLHDYSHRKDHKPTDEHYSLYDGFKRILVNPHSNESDDEELFNWLLYYYWEAYNYHLSKEDEFDAMYQEDPNPNVGSYDDWCHDVAARAVAGFIRVRGVDGTPLINALKFKVDSNISQQNF